MESRIEKVLVWLRNGLEQSEHSTSAFALLVGADAKTVRAALSGRSEITLAQCYSWAAVLGLNPAEALGVGDDASQWSGPRLVQVEGEAGGGTESFRLPAEQAVRLGFALEIDFLFVAETRKLGDSGVPDDVLATFPDSMVIKLDSAYHGHNSPRFTEEGVLLSLSFKGVNDCFFSWDTILQVIFHVGSPGDPKKADDDPSPGPGLRLVK